MAGACAVNNCYNNRKTHPNKGFFGFPTTDYDLCKKWLHNCGRSELSVKNVMRKSGYYKVCADHFEDKCFIDKTKLKLFRRSQTKPVPTIFENNINKFLLTTASQHGPNAMHLLENEANEVDLTTIYERAKPLEQSLQQCDAEDGRLSVSAGSSVRNITTKNDFEPLSVTEALLNLNPDTELYSVENLCRFCMNAVENTEKSLDLFSADEPSKDIRRICQSLFQNKIKICTGLPHLVCEMCVMDFKTCKSIIEKMKEADRYLVSIVKYSLYIDDEVTASEAEESESSFDISVHTIPERSMLIPLCNFRSKPEGNSMKNSSMDERTDKNLEMVCSNVVATNDSSENFLNTIYSSENQLFNRKTYKNCIDMPENFVDDVGGDVEVDIDTDREENCEFINDAQVKKIIYKCLHCFKVHKSYPDLVQHVSLMHKQEPPPFKFPDSVSNHDMSLPSAVVKLKCPRCKDKFFHSKDELDSHWKNTHTFTCHLCTTTFRSKNRLQIHHLKVHDTSTVCSVCGKTFKNVQLRKVHEAIHGKDDDKFVCWICGAVLKLKTSLRTHLKSHEEPIQLCPVCGKKIAYKYGLKKHLRRVHGPRIMRCYICLESFSDENLLRDHIQIAHSGEPYRPYRPYKCKFCNKSFRLKGSVARHETLWQKNGVCPTTSKRKVLRPIGAPTHECEECGRTFYRVKSKNRHQRLHFCTKGDTEIVEKLLIESEVHQCNICGEYLLNKFLLHNHMAEHSGETTHYSCEFCGKTLTNSQAFKVHERVHTGEKPFTCKICDKTFISCTSLYQHGKVHTAEKYTCTICGKYFRRIEVLQRHLVVHESKNKPEFPCGVCGRIFMSHDILLRHIKKMHQQEISGEEPIPENLVEEEMIVYENPLQHIT